MKSETAKVRRRIHALQRRADHLAKRISESDKDLTYDKMELSALNWALDYLSRQFADVLATERTAT